MTNSNPGPRELELRDAAGRILALSDPDFGGTSLKQVAYPVNGGGDAGAGDVCRLVTPPGNYKVSPDAIGLFQPSFASRLSAGIKALNDQGITPYITDGYRTQAMQDARKSAAKAGRSPFPAADISAHQVGLGVDFGLNNNPGKYPAILKAMTDAGLINGAKFHDPVHDFHPDAHVSQNRAGVERCAAVYSKMKK